MADIYTQAGEELVVDIIDGTVGTPTYHVGWGTGAGTAAKGDTILFTEASEARTATTNTQPSVDINEFRGTITSDGTKTITNAGILSALTGGTLLLHSNFTGVALVLNDAIDFIFTLEQA